MSKTIKAIIGVMIGIVLVIGIYFFVSAEIDAKKVRSYDKFIELVEGGRFDENGTMIEGTFVPENERIHKVVID